MFDKGWPPIKERLFPEEALGKGCNEANRIDPLFDIRGNLTTLGKLFLALCINLRQSTPRLALCLPIGFPGLCVFWRRMRQSRRLFTILVGHKPSSSLTMGLICQYVHPSSSIVPEET